MKEPSEAKWLLTLWRPENRPAEAHTPASYKMESVQERFAAF